jgi:hypothetical protein
LLLPVTWSGHLDAVQRPDDWSLHQFLDKGKPDPYQYQYNKDDCCNGDVADCVGLKVLSNFDEKLVFLAAHNRPLNPMCPTVAA